MYLITAYFDEETNRIIRRHIERIAACSGNDFMTRNNVPPHLTISAVEARDINELVPSVRGLGGEFLSGEINIVSVGTLLPYVMYITPVMNDYLRTLSQRVYDALPLSDEIKVNRFYVPGNWLPHVTLGKTLDKDQMREAFFYLQDNFSPFRARVTSIGLSRVNPYEEFL